MNKPLLSVLIPTVVGRELQYKHLLNKLMKSGNGRFLLRGIVEDIRFYDNKEMTIGEKREKLYQMAAGLYSWQIDDDDDIADNAIGLILEAIKSNPQIPCITFRERCMINGVYKSSNHSIKYNHWEDNADGYDYVRCPFYKDVIRTDIAKQVPFEHIRYNEDERFSYALKPWLTSEIHIDEELYYYNYEPKESHEERYGINQ
jgi:hypothetical protein